MPQGVRDRAAQMVLDHAREYHWQWAAIMSIAEKIGCTAETLREWLRRAERDAGERPGSTTEGRERLAVRPVGSRNHPRGAGCEAST